jgi:rRNA maturation endonuclease Nob1
MGYLYPKDIGKLTDASIRLLRNKVEAKQMGNEGRVIAATKFDIQKQAHHLGMVYRELLHAPG